MYIHVHTYVASSWMERDGSRLTFRQRYSLWSIDWNQVIFKGLIIKGIYGREMFETWYKMASLLQSGLDLSPIISHRFSVDDFQKGFDTMGSGQSGKVILDWQ